MVLHTLTILKGLDLRCSKGERNQGKGSEKFHELHDGSRRG